jgi:hypothetical protein
MVSRSCLVSLTSGQVTSVENRTVRQVIRNQVKGIARVYG